MGGRRRRRPFFARLTPHHPPLLSPSDPRVSHLALYDVQGTPGVAADLSHIDTPAAVSAHTGPAELGAALSGAALVVIPAGVPRKPGMTRDDLFNINAGIVATLAEGVAQYCPTALVAVISNPVNSTVPIAAAVLKKAGVYDPRRLFGVTTLDVVRARAFVAEAAGVPRGAVDVPVVGGHAGATILPLISQAKPRVNLPDATIAALTARIQDAGTEVVAAKAGTGSATLSMAYAAARFAGSCLAALGGAPGVVECAYVECHDAPGGAPFYARRVEIGAAGVAAYLPLGPLSAAEQAGVAGAHAELVAQIEKGVAFVRGRQQGG
jgi:malate dehydrogenase